MSDTLICSRCGVIGNRKFILENISPDEIKHINLCINCIVYFYMYLGSIKKINFNDIEQFVNMPLNKSTQIVEANRKYL